jgi:excisionase family DNA binding protein
MYCADILKRKRGLSWSNTGKEIPMQTEKILYSRREAAQLLGICTLTVDKLVQRGELTPKRIGDRVMFSKKELARFAGVTA